MFKRNPWVQRLLWETTSLFWIFIIHLKSHCFKFNTFEESMPINPLTIECMWMTVAFWRILRIDILFSISQSKPRMDNISEPSKSHIKSHFTNVPIPLDLKVEYILILFFNRIRSFILNKTAAAFLRKLSKTYPVLFNPFSKF